MLSNLFSFIKSLFVVSNSNLLFKSGDCFMDDNNFQYVICTDTDEELPQNAFYIIEVYDANGTFKRLSQASHGTLELCTRVVDITILSPDDECYTYYI